MNYIWMNVNDSLPKDGTIILMYIPSWVVLYTGYYSDGNWFDADGMCIELNILPTHWMSIEPPTTITHIDIPRMSIALSSESVIVPDGVSREETRQLIISHVLDVNV